jgi:hypothetical protein
VLRTNFCLSAKKESFVSHKTIIALTTAVALGCVPFATNAVAAGDPAGSHNAAGHAMSGHAMGGRAVGGHGHPGYARGGHVGQYGGGYYGSGYYGNGNGPVYDTCDGYNGCPGYGIPFVGGLINGALGGY